MVRLANIQSSKKNSSSPSWQRRAGLRAGLLVCLGILVFIGSNYVWAWQDAYQLSRQLMSEADASYAQGEYLEALMGYEERDPFTGKTLQRGGYVQVVYVWQSPYAWPRPNIANAARARIHDIIQVRLTVADAERFVQANSGRENSYLPDIYLRLGELYEADGDRANAQSVYREVVEFFASRPDIIATAQLHLQTLENQP